MNLNLTSRGLLSGFCLGLASPVLFLNKLDVRDSQFLTPAEYDMLAMRSDWVSVGENLGAAIGKYETTYGDKEKNGHDNNAAASCP